MQKWLWKLVYTYRKYVYVVKHQTEFNPNGVAIMTSTTKLFGYLLDKKVTTNQLPKVSEDSPVQLLIVSADDESPWGLWAKARNKHVNSKTKELVKKAKAAGREFDRTLPVNKDGSVKE